MLASTSKQRINDSLSRRVDPTSPQMRARTGSSGSGSRPRRTSFGEVQSLRLSPDAPKPSPRTVAEDEIPPLPTSGSSFALPPPVATPKFAMAGADDGIASLDQHYSPPLAVPPLSRPAALRRALSDYDSGQRAPLDQFLRTQSATADLDKAPKRPENSDIVTESANDHQLTPGHTVSTNECALSDGSPSPPDAPEPSAPPSDLEPVNQQVGELNLVDEGDVLPTGDYQMDVTFDDEGLNTLERIFLLSQSDFGFHRAYVARVLGDLLEDVDPCESVEYVLPLLNGYSVDEDETVREAFSSELHRILWYFFSTCRLLSGPQEIFTVTSAGIQSVGAPSQDEQPEIPDMDIGRRFSLVSTAGPSSGGSSLTYPQSSLSEHSDADTPGSATSIDSANTSFSPLPWVDINAPGDHDKPPAHLVAQPELAISTFTPLLGNLMLSPNPVVGDHTRDAIIAVIARLRGTVDEEKWLRSVGDQDKRKTYISQNGYHAHDLRPFSTEAKRTIEAELVNGIVLGMGRLSTEIPDSFYDTVEHEHEIEAGTEHEPQSRVGAEHDSHDDHKASADISLSEEADAFRQQLEQEAEAGRAISLYLIGSLCDVYTGEEIVSRGFLDQVLRAPDGDETTRTEGAVALSRMAKIVPGQYLQQLVSRLYI